ncbi:MAG: VOC family protein [Gemmatimonadetes bacterium]|jgi:catechol 2,3-dioxygenase-like lactoylglutathione lyase family enzyme|nr:VOC family protein [Gemmatimonadota bacterium]
MNFTGVCLHTDDIPRLRTFYQQVLRIDPEGGDVHCVFSIPGGTLTMFTIEGSEEMAPGSMTGVGYGGVFLEFQVDDIDAEFARLQSPDFHWVKPPETYPWGRRSAWLRDLDGNIVNLYSDMTS